MKYSAMLLLAAMGLLTVQAQASSTERVPERPDKQAPLPSFPKMPDQAYLTLRPLSAIPDGAFGDKVRLGYQLFVNTQQLRDKYVGNELNCANCHMDAGRKANASPLWGAYFAYPAYRKKDDKVSSFEERIQGCFNYSMNGKAPASGSPELVAISAYAYWLGMGGLMDEAKISGPVPELSDAELVKGAKREDFPLPEILAKAMTVEQRANLPGRGYPEIPKPELAYSPERGKEVYVAHCQTCHGIEGQGQAIADVYALPPLWGPKSYNWGAGMHRVNTAAFFIYENMPFGKSMQLTHQQAWDVAAYINSHERPQDPRSKGDVKQAQEKYHNDSDYYGLSVDGKVLGTESYPVFPKKS